MRLALAILLSLALAACDEECNRKTCYEGCCAKDGRCMVPTAEYLNQFCGAYGEACQDCGPEAKCSPTFTCVTTCTAQSCAGGCCQAGICKSGTALEACGAGGGACTDCAAKGESFRCVGHACTQCRVSGASCAVDADCCSGSCPVALSVCG